MMPSPIHRMIDAVCHCVKCGAAMGACDCVTECGCGWFYDKGGHCRNPNCSQDTDRRVAHWNAILRRERGY